MVTLKEVIASVLRDVLEAQHEANLLTEALSEEYSKEGMPKHLLVPAVNIGEMEITLNYAINSHQSPEGGVNGEDVESLEVIVDGKELAKLPPECIQSMTFRVGPNYNK